MEGELERATELQEQLDELEERAQELDRVRSSNISSIRYELEKLKPPRPVLRL